MQPPIGCPTEGCLVTSSRTSYRHVSKTYPRKPGVPGPSGPHLPDQEPQVPGHRDAGPLRRPSASRGVVRDALAFPETLSRSSGLVSLAPARVACEARAASQRRESVPHGPARRSLMRAKDTLGAPTCPRPPAACRPRSQPPGVSWTRALAPPGLRPSGPGTPSACPRCGLRTLLWTTTLPLAGRHPAADLLVPSRFGRPWLGVHVDGTPDLRARRCSGGIGTATVRTHWVTRTHVMGSLPMPRFRIYLGTSSA